MFEDTYTSTLAVASVVTLLVTLKARVGAGNTASKAPADFKRFQVIFLGIYYIAMTADWLQGPYVYALYSSYGFSKHDIAVLFVGGFGASMVFGTFVGAAADKLGRKRLCQLYCVLYILSCVTKHARDYNMLMLGRVLGGVATSLLFSSFESWMVCEHNSRGFDAPSMSDTFSLMYFGNSLCAIFAGIAAEGVANYMPLTPYSGMWHFGGYCSPFDLSAMFLALDLILISVLWSENYGDASGDAGCKDLATPIAQMKKEPSILLAGAVISLFEGSMYIFVFNWTPALSANATSSPPFGLIFATFMVACMGGSSLFAIAVARLTSDRLLAYVLLVASIALGLPLVSTSTASTLCAFLLFEACVGVYWPAMGTVRSQVVPEETRATIYNIFRVPLNAIVLGVLLNQMSTTTAFVYCSAMLLLAFVLQRVLIRRLAGRPHGQSADESYDEEKNTSKLLSSSSDKDY